MRMNAEKKIFFDVVRKPSNDVCYYCHTTRMVGEDVAPDWTHDEDVHLRAGMSCSDCHRNGIGHHTVRGFEGEQHPVGNQRGHALLPRLPPGRADRRGACSGRTFGGTQTAAPWVCHRCTWSDVLYCLPFGTRPGQQALQVQTAMAHGLGLPTHQLDVTTEPEMVAPVMLRTDEVLYPHRMVWPAFWGEMQGESVTPLNPDAVHEALRRDAARATQFDVHRDVERGDA